MLKCNACQAGWPDDLPDPMHCPRCGAPLQQASDVEFNVDFEWSTEEPTHTAPDSLAQTVGPEMFAGPPNDDFSLRDDVRAGSDDSAGAEQPGNELAQTVEGDAFADSSLNLGSESTGNLGSSILSQMAKGVGPEMFCDEQNEDASLHNEPLPAPEGPGSVTTISKLLYDELMQPPPESLAQTVGPDTLDLSGDDSSLRYDPVPGDDDSAVVSPNGPAQAVEGDASGDSSLDLEAEFTGTLGSSILSLSTTGIGPAMFGREPNEDISVREEPSPADNAPDAPDPVTKTSELAEEGVAPTTPDQLAQTVGPEMFTGAPNDDFSLRDETREESDEPAVVASEKQLAQTVEGDVFGDSALDLEAEFTGTLGSSILSQSTIWVDPTSLANEPPEDFSLREEPLPTANEPGSVTTVSELAQTIDGDTVEEAQIELAAELVGEFDSSIVTPPLTQTVADSLPPPAPPAFPPPLTQTVADLVPPVAPPPVPLSGNATVADFDLPPEEPNAVEPAAAQPTVSATDSNPLLQPTVDDFGTLAGEPSSLGDATVDDIGKVAATISGANAQTAVGRTMDFHTDSGSPGDTDHINRMWGATLGNESRPNATIKVDSTVSGAKSSLVVKSRAFRKKQNGARDEVANMADPADYELLDVLGEGGMGVVYAARQASVDRLVAVKMLKQGSGSAEQREKFISEAVVTGDLDHPNIVPIYDLGTNEAGALFYSMKRVRGTPWVDVVRKKSLIENLDILMRVADAVAFAHASGVVHRDLKPENIMLGDFGEVLVMDWGLALANEQFRHAGTITQTGSMGGTPAYMAPEMATGPIERVGPAADIYLLGGILYEIVTGRLPHTGNSVLECLRAASRNEIQPTNKTGELVNIALKAMSTKPKDRYASVQEFQLAIRAYESHAESLTLGARAEEELKQAEQSGDYQGYARAMFAFQEALVLWEGNDQARTRLADAKLAYARSALGKADYDLGLSLLDPADPHHVEVRDELLAARRERESREKRLKRFKMLFAATAATAVAVILGALVMISIDRNRAIEAERIAQEQRKAAEVARGRAEDATKVAESERERAERERQNAETQKDLAETEKDRADVARAKAVEARDAAEEAKDAEEYEAYVAKIGLAAAKIDENAFDNAATLLQQCPPERRQWEWGRLKYLCQQSVASFGADAPVDAVAFSPDGKLFATGSWDGKARLWTTESGKSLFTWDHGQYVHAVAFSPSGKVVAVAGSAPTVQLFDVKTGEPGQEFKGHGDSVLSVKFSPDGRWLLTSSYDKSARLWDVASGEQLQVLEGHNWWVWSANFAPDGKRIVTASQDGKVNVWTSAADASSPKFEKTTEFIGHRGPVYDAVFAPDGRTIASGGFDKLVLLWNPDDIKPIDLKERVAGNFEAPPKFIALRGHTAAVRSVSYSAQGNRIVSGSQDNSVRIWDVASGETIQTLRGHGGQVRNCKFSPDGAKILSASHDHQAKLWSIDAYEEVRVLRARVLEGHTDDVLSASFSPDGEHIVTASRDRTARTWQFGTGKNEQEFKEGHEFLATSALLLPDGKRLLTGGGDNTVRIWDVATGGELQRLEHAGRSGAIALAHNARWLVTGSDARTAKIWDLRSGKLVQELVPKTTKTATQTKKKSEPEHADVTALAVAGNDQLLLVGDSYGHCTLWQWNRESKKWQEQHRLRGHSATITGAVFRPDDKRVVTASGDQSVRQWDTSTGEEIVEGMLKFSDWVSSIALSPSGNQLLVGSVGAPVQLWDLDRASAVAQFDVGESRVSSVEISPDGLLAVAVLSEERTVRLWDISSGRELHSQLENRAQAPMLDLARRGGLVWSAAFTPDSQHLVTVGGNDARMWNIATGEETMSFSPHGAVASASFSPAGDRIVTGSWDNSAKIWDAASGKSLMKLAGGHTSFVNSAVFSPDGKQVLTASDDATARLWDADSGQPTKTIFRGHKDRIRQAVFSADGNSVLTASNDKTARLWDAGNGEQRTEFSGHTWGVRCAAISVDGTRVITGSEDNSARIWNAETGEQLLVLQGHPSAVTSVAFSPNGSRALTASSDNTAKLWDARTGKEILTLGGHAQEVTSVSFSPDGRYVLTAGRDGKAIIWLAVEWSEGEAPKDEFSSR